MFDAEGNINSANRSAEALFGYDGDELAQRNLGDLLAPESQHGVFEYLASVKSAGAASLLDHGRDALGRVRQGGIIPLSMTMGRTRADGPNFFAVFRDLSQAKQSEKRVARGAAADRPRRQRQGRHAGADQPRGAHAAQRHHRLCRGDDRRALRRARQRALCRIHEGHPRFRRTGDLHHQRPARSVADRDRQARSFLHQPEPQRTGRELRRGDAAAGQPRTHHHPHLAGAHAAACGGRRARVAPDRAQPDRQFDPSRQCRRPGHRLDRAVRLRRGDAAGPRYRPGPQRQ